MAAHHCELKVTPILLQFQPEFGPILGAFEDKIWAVVSLVSGDFWSFAQIVPILFQFKPEFGPIFCVFLRNKFEQLCH